MRSVNGRENSKIMIGILGAGSVVKDIHLPVLSTMHDVEVLWLCDKVETQAQNLAKALAPQAQVFTRLEDCPDVDIVLVAIPVGLRRESMRHIFARRWHVLCEKPFAVSLAEHDDLLAQAAHSHVEIGVGLVRRYYSGTLLAQELIKTGVLGDVVEVWASQGARITRTDRGDWYQGDVTAAGGGILIETGSHVIDQAFSALGVCDFAVNNCEQRMINGLDIDTKANGKITTAQQSDIGFTLALSNIRDLYNGIAIRFTRGILKLSISTEKPLLCTSTDQPLAHLDSKEGAHRVYQAFYLEWRDFIRQCFSSDGYRASISADRSRCTTSFIDQCYQLSRLHEGALEAVSQS